jgi:hypothetical protein
MYTLCPSTSLQMPNIELHCPGIEPGPPLIECGRSTIELWNLYIIWVCLRSSTHIMYFIRRCWFLKCSEEIHYVPIGDGDMWYYVPVNDGWEEVLGRNVYIMSQYFSPNAKYWTASSRNRTRAPPLIECGRSTIELWSLSLNSYALGLTV